MATNAEALSAFEAQADKFLKAASSRQMTSDMGSLLIADVIAYAGNQIAAAILRTAVTDESAKDRVEDG
jgi:hypothetical protein